MSWLSSKDTIIPTTDATVITVTPDSHPPSQQPNQDPLQQYGSSPRNDPNSLSSAIKSAQEIETLKVHAKSRRIGRAIATYYENQNNLIEQMLNPTRSEEDDEKLMKVKIAIYGSLAANILLFCLQLYASVSSGSLALFATMADAFMDLMTGAVLISANVMSRRKNKLKYPVGKQRFETAAIIIFSCVMGALAVELVIEGAKAIVAGGDGTGRETNLNAFNLGCIGVAVVIKACLFVYCNSLRKYPSARVLSQDHLNDILLNVTGIAFSLIGQHLLWYIDPIGGILIASWILYSWGSTAIEHAQKFIGETASPAFLNLITYLAVTHHPDILQIDTVRAYSSGAGYYVEVDVVMDRKTSLDKAHDIGETLQEKLEALEDVERAFVHLDFDGTHRPEHATPSSTSK
ncbi:UNVERIFIED_CONTAM: hypothetical protein HDU68_012066 [Siphonaria sp. JEL0065]|nr:hypothetical protein HDU68_012066 [Siphonaria sp. JEL0065]